MLLEEGIQVSDLSGHKFLGHHDNVVKSVIKGEFNAGGVTESVANKYREQGLRLLKFSKEIPEFNIAINKSIKDADKAALTEAILKLNNRTTEGAFILGSIDKAYTGFSQTSDAEYEEVREMMSKLGML